MWVIVATILWCAPAKPCTTLVETYEAWADNRKDCEAAADNFKLGWAWKYARDYSARCEYRKRPAVS